MIEMAIFAEEVKSVTREGYEMVGSSAGIAIGTRIGTTSVAYVVPEVVAILAG